MHFNGQCQDQIGCKLFFLPTGSCASGGGSPYYFDPTAEPLDNEDNLLWFHNFTTRPDGRVHGNGANDGDVLTSGEQSIKSVMLVNMLTKGEWWWVGESRGTMAVAVQWL